VTTSFDQVRGQDPAVRSLRRALESGRLHHAYRFEGPEGVGKELAAMSLARALVCEAEGALGCGRCSACHRAITLSAEEPRVPLHPDVVLVGRGIYPPSIVGSSEATGIGVEQIRRVVLARAGYPPHEGRALVVIVRAAEELTVQAANALLKTLEEPSARTQFVLITSRPNRLLDTVLSRTLAVRFGPLPDQLIESLLAERGLPTKVAPLAQGSMSLALELAAEDRVKERDEFIAAAFKAIEAPDLAGALALSEHRAQTRDGLREQLGFFAQALASHARSAVSAQPHEAELAARRYAVVLAAITEVERNVQPALALEAMITRIRRA
jgi:DNA polymerase III subunit delta'